jgi:thiol-disulfide isomerase/thioredoxin
MSKRLSTIVLASALALAPARAHSQEAGIMLAAAAPGAAVETLDGRRTDLATYIGKQPVVLEFWATWCPLCKKLEPSLQAARGKYAGKVTFVSVGVRDNQTPMKQKEYAEAKHLGGEFVFDHDGNAVAAYKVPHTSYLVVIDTGGRVVYTGVGGEQDVEAAIAKAFASTNAMQPGGR